MLCILVNLDIIILILIILQEISMSKSKSIKSNVIYEDGFFMGEKDIKIYYKSYEVEDSEATKEFYENIDKYIDQKLSEKDSQNDLVKENEADKD